MNTLNNDMSIGQRHSCLDVVKLPYQITLNSYCLITNKLVKDFNICIIS